MLQINTSSVVLHKIGDAVLSDKTVETIASWQQHDNDSVEGRICDLLKAVGFIARLSEQLGETYLQDAMHHITLISGIAEELEVFKK
jgi:hypothetical protein